MPSTGAGPSFVMTQGRSGREIIADRLDRTRTTIREAADADRDPAPETLYLNGSPFQRRLKRSAVS
jgi:hypothetical protein